MYNLKNLFNNYKSKLIGIDGISEYAVVLPIININGTDNIILEIRSKNLKTQPGEISLPGGRIEKNETPKEAAIREFCEELNCKKENIEIYSPLDKYLNPSKGIIHCFLGRTSKDLYLGIKNDEVEKIITVPLDFFINNKPLIINNKLKTIVSKEFPYKDLGIDEDYYNNFINYPVSLYYYEEYIIWGITANIIKKFIDIVSMEDDNYGNC